MLDFLADEAGQGMVEYGLVLVLASIAAVAVLTALGSTTFGLYDGAMEKINDATGGG